MCGGQHYITCEHLAHGQKGGHRHQYNGPGTSKFKGHTYPRVTKIRLCDNCENSMVSAIGEDDF